MKWLLWLFVSPIAWPQLKTGSVIYVDLSRDQFTFSADSRGTLSTGGRNDMECKIRAFGDKFVFMMAGIVSGNGWDANSVARQIWIEESAKGSDRIGLVKAVADGWERAMEPIYKQAAVISGLKERIRTSKEPDGGVLATAIFAGTDTAGNMELYAVDIIYDPAAFATNGSLNVSHNIQSASSGRVTGGRDEIITEFLERTSQRANEYLDWWLPLISGLPLGLRQVAINTKMVELSILLHPQNSELGFPIDILQLMPKAGISWVQIKPNCPQK